MLNDNGRSYAPTIGGLADHLTGLRMQGSNDALSPRMLFSDLGIKYLGPIDGHDVSALENAMRTAIDLGGSVLVHTVTKKGMGYLPAEQDPADRMHTCGPINPRTGEPKSPAGAVQWTDVFATELLEWGMRRDDLVAITAAMPGPTGLAAFGVRFRTGCSTWGSPSNTLLPPRRDWHSAACIRSSRFTRRSSTAPSTKY